MFYNGHNVTKEFIYTMLFNFRGYGNPNGYYWFIGMEEHWDSGCVKDVTKMLKLNDLEYYSSNPSLDDSLIRCQFEQRAAKPNTFESGVKKIIEYLQKENLDQTIANDVFITNARFMPFNYDKAVEFFGVSVIDQLKDEEIYRKNLYDNWKQKDHLTVCLSAKYREYFQEIFKNEIFNKFKFEKFKESKELYCGTINNNKIFQMYHPRYRKFNSYLLKILPLIKESLIVK